MADKTKSLNVANASGNMPSNTKEVEKRDLIVQNSIWTAGLEKEKQCRRSWEMNWAPLFNSLRDENSNQPEEEMQIQEVCSNVNFKTEAEKYGSRLDTENGTTIRNLEFRIQSNYRKKKKLIS